MAWDVVWEQIFREREWGKYPAEELIRFVAQRFYSATDRAEVKLLEVGCGPGGNLWYMAREGFATYGIDGSPTAVRRARQRLNAEVPDWKGEVLQGDITSLPFASETFDAVIESEAVCCNTHENALVIYNEAARVTKPGGWLFSRTFAEGCWGDGTGQQIGYHAWLPAEGPLVGLGCVRFSTLDDLNTLIKGFQIKSVEFLHRSSEGRSQMIKEWLIIGRKP